MRTGPSIFLIAVGAILRFALETSVDGINLGTAGVILMVVGVVGLLISLGMWISRSQSRRRPEIGRGQVVVKTETVSTRESESV